MKADIAGCILMEISRWYIDHRLFTFHIGSRHGYRIDRNVTRDTLRSIAYPFEESGIIKGCHFDWLAVIINLRIIIRNIKLADNIG